MTRVIRDDPAKRQYEWVLMSSLSREQTDWLVSYRKLVQWSDVKDAITDLGLWGHLIITAIGLTPTTPLGTCEFHIRFMDIFYVADWLCRSAHGHQSLPLRRRAFRFINAIDISQLTIIPVNSVRR